MRFSSLTLPARLALAAALMFAALLPAAAAREIEAITFAVEPGQSYLPLAEATAALRWPAQVNEAGRCVQLNGLPVPAGSLRVLNDGTELVSTLDLVKAGAEVTLTSKPATVAVRCGGRRFKLTTGAKRVEISLARQQLRAWQGNRLVLETRLSSGRNGRTPAGDFRAGPFKARFHRSSRYNNAPMPWSVQINGHVFIHGFTIVPDYPASHGCIRLPLTGFNPAKLFFEWVDVGTPVRVTRT